MDLPTSEASSSSTPPIFTIDLSLPPRQRYQILAQCYKSKLQSLTGLFDDLLRDLGLGEGNHPWIKRLARSLLRGVHSQVETAELQGIAEVTGLSMYLLVSFNVVLDLLMGCTSGAVKSLERGKTLSEARMLHFRTLDWGMDPLRSVIVQLHFVRSKSSKPEKIIARSISYAGFVGVLTGVRPKLSISLNFRGMHDAQTRTEHFRFYLHHLLVLLGYRQSISSVLRNYLIPETDNRSTIPSELSKISQELGPKHTTAAYLIFSDGERAISMEKDFFTGKVRESASFIATTNHDVEKSSSEISNLTPTPTAEQAISSAPRNVAGLEELLEESKDRLLCIEKKWSKKVKRLQRRASRHSDPLNEDNVTVTEREVIEWVSTWPTTNECTHFATVMDPQEGTILWTKVYNDPISDPSEIDM